MPSHDIISLVSVIGICVMVPITIVWLICRSITNRDNRRAEVLVEAIRSNTTIDADRIAQALSKKPRSAREILNQRLLRGSIFTLVGAALSIACAILCENTHMDLTDLPGIMLVTGASSLAIGISYLVVYFATRNHLDD